MQCMTLIKSSIKNKVKQSELWQSKYGDIIALLFFVGVILVLWLYRWPSFFKSCKLKDPV